jgi:hypothetical protein
MRTWTFITASLLLLGCDTTKDKIDTGSTDSPVDFDGDGYSVDEDCDDADATTHPGATEVCDGVDNNCDDQVDEDVMDTWYADADGDGYGDPGSSTSACDGPADTVPTATDCDDTNPDVYPSSPELCDGIDNDCDGEIDNGVLGTWYQDADGDGYGDPEVPADACDAPSDFVDDATDCDDTTELAHPGGIEVCDDIDNDCDGLIDEEDATDATQWFADVDGDGYGDPDSTASACETPTGYVDQARDCNDLDPDIRPDAPEVCDGLDNDCDELIDDADPDVDISAGGTWYADVDTDGYGDPAVATSACDQPTGTVTDNTDCDDAAIAVNPAATEVCNGIDDDCDALVDDDDSDLDLSTATTWYADSDGDLYGDASAATTSCDAPTGGVTDATDCDDTNGDVNPGETEICNGIDDDCDTLVDDDDSSLDASTTTTWYADTDGDLYGDASSSSDSCDAPTGGVTDATDCDDTDGNVNPGETEICDAADTDEDCSGDADDDDAGVDSSGFTTWYTDADSDDYLASSPTTTSQCDEPTVAAGEQYLEAGEATSGTDCDDTDPSVNPGATEVCDGIDNDCDGDIDDDDLVLGDSADCAALDCDEILTERPTVGDDIYWVDPDGSGAPFDIFCDMTNDGGGWTLAANIDDVNDPWLLAQQDTWENTTLRNETQLATHTVDIAVTAKYRTWTSLQASDVRVVYKNDSKYFMCEGLSVVDTLDTIFSDTPSPGTCSSTCTTWSEDRLTQATQAPVGLNCSDVNEGWMNPTSLTTAENARIGGQSSWSTCCVINAWAGAAGDRGFSTGYREKTWGDYTTGQVTDDNIMIFVR